MNGVNEMNSECNDVDRVAARAGDRYYGALTAWLTKRRESVELREEVSVLGRVYAHSLQLLINCFTKIRRTPRLDQKLQVATDLHARVNDDLAALESRTSRASLTPQTDEV